MSLNRFLLNSLVLASRILSVNPFRFNETERRFELLPTLYMFYKWIVILFGLPLFGFACLTVNALMPQIQDAITENLTGINGINAFTSVMCGVLILRTTVIYGYVAFLLYYRTADIWRLLNRFVRVHDQYVALFGPTLKISWILWIVLIGKMCTATLVLFNRIGNIAGVLLVYAYFCLPATSGVIAVTGLIVLHGFYRGTTVNSKILERKAISADQVEELLNFHYSLMGLKFQLESYVKVFALMELLPVTDFMSILGHILRISLTKSVSMNFENFIACGIVIFPTIFAHLTSQIAEAEENFFSELLGQQPMQLRSTKSRKSLELFHLHKIVINLTWNRSSWRALSVRKDFVLRYYNLLIINGSLVFTFFIFAYLSGELPETLNADIRGQ